MTQAQPNQESEMSYVASVKTALSGPDGTIMRKIPEAYAGRTVRTVLEYLTDRSQLSSDELAAGESVRAEMRDDYTVSVNGRTAKPEDSVSKLFEERMHKGVPYQALEIEIASVQEGGLVYMLG